MDRIKSWSYSALDKYETCPYMMKLNRVDKVPELDRGPPPPGMKEWPNDRGNRVHDAAEMFVRGERTDLIKELKHFEPEFHKMKELYESEMVALEDMWCYDENWCAVDKEDFKNIWLRVKLDAGVFINEAHAALIDYKTGKKFGNEIKHAKQGQLYAISMFMRYPELLVVEVEFWYLDHNLMYRQKYTRKQCLIFWRTWNAKGKRMTSDTEFDANPNAHNCRFCPYGPEESSNKWVKKNGKCKFGV